MKKFLKINATLFPKTKKHTLTALIFPHSLTADNFGIKFRAFVPLRKLVRAKISNKVIEKTNLFLC